MVCTPCSSSGSSSSHNSVLHRGHVAERSASHFPMHYRRQDTKQQSYANAKVRSRDRLVQSLVTDSVRNVPWSEMHDCTAGNATCLPLRSHPDKSSKAT